MSLTSRETSNSGTFSRNPDPSRLARKYAKVVNNQTKEVSVGLGDNEAFYISLGMTEQDVQLADNGKWYLVGHAPRESDQARQSRERSVEVQAAKNNPLIPLTNNLVWSVGRTQRSGASKHFTDINSAINEALRYRGMNNKFIDLYLTSDVTIPSQLYYYGVDLKFLRIRGNRTSNNAGFKLIAGANLNNNRNDRYLFFFDKSHAPIFQDVTFKGNWVPNATARTTAKTNASKNDNGLYLKNCSCFELHNCTLENFNRAVTNCYSSTVSFYGSGTTVQNCATGIEMYDNSKILTHNTTFSNNVAAVRAHSNSTAYLFRGGINKCALGFEVRFGSQIATNGVTIPPSSDNNNKNTRDANQNFNTISANGIIYR